MQIDVATEALEDVIAGLSQRPRRLPAKYFYDTNGSRLFDEICRTEEYYVTRTEIILLREIAPELARLAGSHVSLVELGSGSSTKTRIVLDALDQPASYLPVDISADYMTDVAQRLADDYADVAVLPVSADYTQPFTLPNKTAPGRTVVFFPGSSIGNFGPTEILTLLRRVRGHMGEDGQFVIGIDLVKDASILNAAYNDSRGVTAEFNLNMLDHLNGVAGTTFRTSEFKHRAFFNEQESRIEMHLIARCDTSVLAGDRSFRISQGEGIRTEVSYKFTVDGFARIAAAAGLTLMKSWSDERNWFSILMFERAEPPSL